MKIWDRSHFLTGLGFCVVLAVSGMTSPLLHAQEATKEKDGETTFGEEWVRVKKNGQGQPLALEVAIVRYVPKRFAQQFRGKQWQQLPPAPEFVDLIGAVHVGDRRYYDALNRRFRKYQALLYELVAPKGVRVERGRGTSNLHPVGALQNGLKSLLELEHQLEQIDYTRPNFVHADMSPDEFAESMATRDESFMQMYARMMGQAIAEQSEQAARGESTDVDILAAMFSNDRARKLKIAIAKQFQSMESVLSGMSGPEGSTLITERNKRALDVLRQQLGLGKHHIGVFYGAGHLTDMGEKLEEDFGLVPVAQVWLEAWDLRPEK